MQTTLAFQGIAWRFVSYLASGSEHWCEWQFGFLVGTTEKHSKHSFLWIYWDILYFHCSDLSALVFHSCVNMKFPVDIRCWVSLQVLLYHLHIFFDEVFLYIFYSFLCNKLYFKVILESKQNWVKGIESESEVAQSCLTLCNPMDYSLPGSSVHGIFQTRVLEWVAIAFSRGSSQPRDWTRVSHIVGRHFTVWATREVWKVQRYPQYPLVSIHT